MAYKWPEGVRVEARDFLERCQVGGKSLVEWVGTVEGHFHPKGSAETLFKLPPEQAQAFAELLEKRGIQAVIHGRGGSRIRGYLTVVS